MIQDIKSKNKYYFIDDNRCQGEYKEWFGNGTLKLQCQYINNKLHNEYKEWYSPGIPKEHCFYVDGNLHGEYKSWSTKGKLKLHCFYVNGSYVSFKTLLLPTTPEELLYFRLKYDMQLLPKEQVC